MAVTLLFVLALSDSQLSWLVVVAVVALVSVGWLLSHCLGGRGRPDLDPGEEAEVTWAEWQHHVQRHGGSGGV